MSNTHLFAALVLHIHRELIQYLAEVCLIRDLYQLAGQPTPTRQEAS